jgi:superfamily II DNA or RNA helicase
MTGAAALLRTRPLRRTQSAEDYSLYKAALEWSLDEPIVIDSAADLKSEPTWKGKGLTPYDHQVTNLITFCRRLPVTLLADDVGLGKTISAGLVVSELISRGRVQRLLIVCPKLLIPQWIEELDTKFDIKAEPCSGRKLITYQPPWDTGAIVTTYHSARLYLEEIPTDRFDMLILDEAHKLRNLYGTPTAPQVAKRFRQALGDRLFRYVLMLTATPIQNRLWDIYSLVDLLTVARGHENPFGSPGMFTRKYIADTAQTARQLKLSAQDDFRSVVYSYMSRVRRGDAKLQFPERVVRMHTVPPSPEELRLIAAIAEPIQTVNPLSQISILQALVSSPHALKRQLENMARKGTFPADAAREVAHIVDHMGLSAKIVGVGALAGQLRAEMPDDWRMVVFTTRKETQTTIETYLSERGISVGTINGNSADRNQDTLAAFRASPPKINVIVSTEAGSEGVNLQAANVLVNYDLPWNPMIVEQRIGRIQRLQSRFANVCIYNITLAGTFEQVIVGRLMEKLQLASHAIGDVEALLEATGMDDEDDEEGGDGLAHQIRKLVIQSLRGIDVDAAAELAAQSILDAKTRLELEEKSINDMLGDMDGHAYQGPLTPSLPPPHRSMNLETFVRAALQKIGATVAEMATGLLRVDRAGAVELIKLPEASDPPDNAILYASGTPSFSRLVTQLTDGGLCKIEDHYARAFEEGSVQASAWIKSFGGIEVGKRLTDASRTFDGEALVRVRATVAHDSYDRLVSVRCSEAVEGGARGMLEPLPDRVADLRTIGLKSDALTQAAAEDDAIAEFSRFYEERRAVEVAAADGDDRKKKKLFDEFTPRLEFETVGIEGIARRELTFNCHYKLQATGQEYESVIATVPSSGELSRTPQMMVCEILERSLPSDCVGVCSISNKQLNCDALVVSDVSGRSAASEYGVRCYVSGQLALTDEVTRSEITGEQVITDLLHCSSISGVHAEAEHFSKCAFTGEEVLKIELRLSELSSKPYRIDQEQTSALTGRKGHQSEFVMCLDTGQTIAAIEAETCSVTGKTYAPGVLKKCHETEALTHPSELETCSVANAPVQRRLLKTSDVSGRRAVHRHFAQCAFTGCEALSSELRQSEISGKSFRTDQVMASAPTGRTGHQSEFFNCFVTKGPVASDEGQRCSATSHWVAPGVLEQCAHSGDAVLPSELDRCTVSGAKVLRRFLVESSISGARLLEENAYRSIDGLYCIPSETQQCRWSGDWFHPDDIEICALSGIPIHRQYDARQGTPVLRALTSLLDEKSRRADASHLWPEIAEGMKPTLGKCLVEAAGLSPDGKSLAVVLEVKKLLGLRTRHAGLIYATDQKIPLGRVVVGQRSPEGWRAL